MIRRLVPALAAMWIVVQLGPDAAPARCWIMDGVAMKPGPASPFGPWWLTRDAEVDGAMIRATVGNGDLDAAARRVGLKDAKGCK